MNRAGTERVIMMLVLHLLLSYCAQLQHREDSMRIRMGTRVVTC